MANESISKDQRDYITILKERDKAKPLAKCEVLRTEDGKPYPKCSICGYPISFTVWVFCPVCGNRLDRENWAL